MFDIKHYYYAISTCKLDDSVINLVNMINPYCCFQMPGVNLPASQVSYYLLTLLVCGILHEIGHAIAAVR